MRISLAAILVEDQDNASRFYTEILGFRVETDAPGGGEAGDRVHHRGLPARVRAARGPGRDFHS
jgi:catechol 2,3-dioxygenase-like lactoylglutathione lyase family enzyme